MRPLSCALALAAAACGGDVGPPPADVVVLAAAVHTGAPGAAPAEAVAVADGRIVYVGTEAGAALRTGPATQVVDLGAGTLYPGFVDAHAHLLGVGLRELTLNLDAVGSIAELVEIVRREVEAAEPGAVVSGRGWIETGWPEGRMPAAADLDPVSPSTPVVLARADGHAAVVNSAALAAAGIDASTRDPEGGAIERGPDGAPTGVLIDNAQGLVASLVEAPDATTRAEAFKIGARLYAERGWTGVHNMSVDYADVPMMETLAARGRLPIRIYNALDREHAAAIGEDAPRVGGGGLVETRALKVYFDGALGSRGAALFEPYADRPDTRGLVLIDDAEADRIFEAALRNGVQIAAHAIGDRGNRLALDAMERAFRTVPPEARAVPDPRWRIEHAQIVSPADIPRFASLGVVASMQPSHAIGDLFFAPARLGDARLDGAYAWKSLVRSGAVVAGGSDAPVERGDPLIEFYAAVARRALDGTAGADWRPDEALSRAEALALFTRAPAYAAFAEDERGIVEVGRVADLTGFSIDLMTAPESEIPSARAVFTMVGGRIAYAEERR